MTSPAEKLDRDTLERVKRGDRQAGERFFAAFIDRVYGYVRHLVGDRSLADDISQDAFLRMHRALSTLDPSRDPSGWVFTVVTNTVRDHWRSFEQRNRGRMVELADLYAELPATDESAPARLSREETERAVRRALALLSLADREVILLRTYEGFDTREVAERLGITSEAVRQRHSRAVRRLGQRYRDAMDGDQVTT